MDLKRSLLNIIYELEESKIPLTDVTVISRSSEIIKSVQEDCPYLPNITNTSAFLGCESKIIIWIDSGFGQYREVRSYKHNMQFK